MEFSLSLYSTTFLQNIQTIIKGCPNVRAYFTCVCVINGWIRWWYLCSWSLLWLESASSEKRTVLPICASVAATWARCYHQQGKNFSYFLPPFFCTFDTILMRITHWLLFLFSGFGNRISLFGQYIRMVFSCSTKCRKSHC